ncbi:MAG: phosphoglucosamine mutase [Clostridiales Family XIII bacterium]|jgi:phosphoglucosamine mutase|nr:phosphoglucosamine mutase [Clostridiales Family XIII bacterium]
MGKLFGTDGVRGVANGDLSPELAYRLGRAGAYALGKSAPNGSPFVVIGKDTRVSGDMLEDSLSAGILSMGGRVAKVGVIPTPAIAYLARTMGADCGAVISASHNPFEYNGIKFFNGDGYKLDDAIENEIESLAVRGADMGERVTGAKGGRGDEQTEDALREYTNYLLFGMNTNISGMKLVVDCANGAAVRAAKTVFEFLNAETVFIGCEPDGININAGVGSTYPQTLCETVKNEGADIGLAFDGDADRLIAVDENGAIMDGDRIMYICAAYMKKEGTLKNDLVTATVMSNIGLRLALDEKGIELQLADVGDRYVLEMMRGTGSVLGGEQSGHIIFLERNTTGDGLFAALRLLEALRTAGATASEAASGMRVYPQVLRNARVKEKNKGRYLNDPEIGIAIEKVERQMEGEGRVLIRASGTEPLVRVMLEGADQSFLDRTAGELAGLIEKKLG